MRGVSTYLQEEAPTTSLHPFPVPIDEVCIVPPPTNDTVPLLVPLIPCPIPTVGGDGWKMRIDDMIGKNGLVMGV